MGESRYEAQDYLELAKQICGTDEVKNELSSDLSTMNHELKRIETRFGSDTIERAKQTTKSNLENIKSNGEQLEGMVWDGKTWVRGISNPEGIHSKSTNIANIIKRTVAWLLGPVEILSFDR